MLSTLLREHRILCSNYVDDSHADPAHDCVVSNYHTFSFGSNHIVRLTIDITCPISPIFTIILLSFLTTMYYCILLKPSAVYWLRFLPTRRSRKIQSGIAARWCRWSDLEEQKCSTDNQGVGVVLAVGVRGDPHRCDRLSARQQRAPLPERTVGEDGVGAGGEDTQVEPTQIILCTTTKAYWVAKTAKMSNDLEHNVDSTPRLCSRPGGRQNWSEIGKIGLIWYLIIWCSIY